jgi:hypothetical protein
VEVLSRDTLQLTFNEDMVNDAELKDPDNYTVVPDGSGIVVTVRAVLTGLEEHVESVVLSISPPTLEETYTATVDGDLTSRDGGGFQASSRQFEARNTKMDSVLKSFPRAYETSHGATIRALLHAVTREDDLIGGNREDFLL